MKSVKWILCILVAQLSQKLGAQQYLLRPAIASGIGTESRVFLQGQLAGNTERLAFNANFQYLDANEWQYVGSYTYGINYDTLDLNHNTVGTHIAEIGLGKWNEGELFFSQSLLTGGLRLSTYKYYDTFEQINRIESSELVVTYQMAGGIHGENFEFGVTARFSGSYNFNQKLNTDKLHGDASAYWQDMKNNTNWLSIEPGVFVGVNMDDCTAATLSFSAPMKRAEQGVFVLPQSYLVSLGLKFYSY